jgi:cell division protein FtsB
MAAIHHSLTSFGQLGAMVVRKRWRAVIFPLVLYAVSGGVTSYFVWHAVNGQRGLKTKEEYQARAQSMNAELAALRVERARWRHRVEMMQADSVDRDLLDEEARQMLGRANKNDLIVLLPNGRS